MRLLLLLRAKRSLGMAERYPGLQALAYLHRVAPEDVGLHEGAAADRVAVRAEAGVPEAVAAHPTRVLVVKAGRIVAREGRLV